jgi:4-carboxymuconolactone decarboxylase
MESSTEGFSSLYNLCLLSFAPLKKYSPCPRAKHLLPIMSSPRFPPLGRNEYLDSSAFDALEQETSAIFGPQEKCPFVYKDANGHLIGPFPFYLAAPDAGLQMMGIFGKLGRIPGLPADAKETVILTVGAHYQAGYELYAHKNVAIKMVGMKEEVVEAMASGEKPSALSEECSLAYDAAKWLLEKPGKLSDELWERCVKTFGRQGTMALVHYT